MAYDFKVGDIVRVKESTGIAMPDVSRHTTILGLSDGGYTAQCYQPVGLGGYEQAIDGVVHKETWNIALGNLELVSRPEPKPIKPVVVYTSACKICKSPARKIAKTQLCSNGRCKSRHSFKKAFPVPYTHIPKDMDDEGFVICHECKGRIHWHEERSDSTWTVICQNKHTRKHKYLNGQKLAYMGSIGGQVCAPSNYIRKEDRWVGISN